jgi:ethanolamine-phosphate phospho-lyase
MNYFKNIIDEDTSTFIC